MKEKEIFEALLKCVELFKYNKIPYTLIGAYAFGVLGGARGTLNLDFMIQANPRILTSLKEMVLTMGFDIDEDWWNFNPLLRDSQLLLITYLACVDKINRLML